MYAHAARKWSLIKLLMYLFLPIMILIFCCQGGSAMYLTPRQQIEPINQPPTILPTINNHQKHQQPQLLEKHYRFINPYQKQNGDNRNTQYNKHPIIGGNQKQNNIFSYEKFVESRNYDENNAEEMNDKRTNADLIIKNNNNINNNNNNNNQLLNENDLDDEIFLDTLKSDKFLNNKNYNDNENIRSDNLRISSSNLNKNIINNNNNYDNLINYENPSESPQFKNIWLRRMRHKRERQEAHRNKLNPLRTNYINLKRRKAHQQQLKTTSSLHPQPINPIIQNDRLWEDDDNDDADDEFDEIFYENENNINDDDDDDDNDEDNNDDDNVDDYTDNLNQISNRNRRDVVHPPTVKTPNYSHMKSQPRFRHQNRKQPKYCSARDPATLTFEAPTVFSGKVKSMSYERSKNFFVTFQIQKVLKQQENFTLPKAVRLQFMRRRTVKCDIYREKFETIGYVREEFEQGRVYYLFVKQINLGNFTILGQPIKKTQKTTRFVEDAAGKNYGQRASIDDLRFVYKNVSSSKMHEVLVNTKIRLVCKVKGSPFPKVTWFKDKKSIKDRIKYKFENFRKKSVLTVENATLEDAGDYECRAKNKMHKDPEKKFIKIKVIRKKDPINHLEPGIIQCSEDLSSSYCSNKGKCKLVESLKEIFCECPDDYEGPRCEIKVPSKTNTSTYNGSKQCSEKGLMGGYYC